MSAVASNLKTLYQCPALWFWHAIGLVFIIDGVIQPLADPVAGEGAFAKYMLVSFWGGMVTASMMKETLGKPLTFCLPGHQHTVRTVIFAVGAVQALLLSLMVLAYPGLEPATRIAGMASVGFVGMTTYLLSVRVMFVVRNAAACWGVPALFLGMTREWFPGLRVAIEDAVVFHPGVNAAVLIPIGLWTWSWMGRRDVARAESGSTFMPMQYLWNRVAQARYSRARRIKQLERRSIAMWRIIDDRFLSKMSRLPALSARRHAVGSRYAQLGDLVPASSRLALWIAVAVLFFLVILGFASSRDGEGGTSTNFLYILPTIVGMSVQIPIYTTLVVPAGRSFRYRTGLIIGLYGAGFALVLGASLCAVSRGIGALIPEMTLGGRTLVYQPMNPELILAPLLAIPLMYTCQLVFPRNPQIAQTVLLIAAILFAMAFPGAFQWENFPVFAVLAALCWWCFVGCLHHYCYHQDLVVG